MGTIRILPVLTQCPPALRELFCAAHACQACRLCNDALFVVPDVRSEQAAGVQMLPEVQAEILKTQVPWG